MKHKEIKGAMAAVGLTWEEVQAQAPEGVVAACHNGADSVTISGDAEQVTKFCDQLQEKGIFAKVDLYIRIFKHPISVYFRLSTLLEFPSTRPQCSPSSRRCTNACSQLCLSRSLVRLAGSPLPSRNPSGNPTWHPPARLSTTLTTRALRCSSTRRSKTSQPMQSSSKSHHTRSCR